MGKVVCILLLLPLACYCQLPEQYMAIRRDPCEQFTELIHIVTRSPHYPGTPLVNNDTRLARGWYAGPVGWELLNDDPGSSDRCGTRDPIYRTGKMGPTSFMCIRANNRPCNISFNINTRMCGAREIYELKTHRPLSAFCFECTGRKLDILIISDVSRSVTHSVFEKMKHFQRSLISWIGVSQQTNAVALMEFSSTPRVLIPLDSPSSRSKPALQSMINQQQYENGPSTDLADALDMAVTEVFTAQKGDRADADNMVILFTDGLLCKSEKEDLAAYIGQLSAKAEVFVVASRGVNTVIREIASKPEGNHIVNLEGAGAVAMFRRKIMPCHLVHFD
ncbi:cartilage matrix protein-like [Haliotis rubra]|uniref:cartilage matrix protein-like n=1 Tax=Haliotis rubra TaxID=36100 RepID=UPI001EE5855B|nr:cartilage matrix protein-like [Haliotis rubra]